MPPAPGGWRTYGANRPDLPTWYFTSRAMYGWNDHVTMMLPFESLRPASSTGTPASIVAVRGLRSGLTDKGDEMVVFGVCAAPGTRVAKLRRSFPCRGV
jgi:hypothetical protein